MKKLLAIIVCKTAAFVLGLIGRGSSKPGALALKLCPDIISRLRLPSTVVAVTGSNGKTSTVELLVRILERSGRSVCWNKEGSNQIEGVAAMLIRRSTLSGRVKSDCVVLESDEQYARHTFKYLKPTHFAVLNLLRDQLTRNGHQEFIYGKISEAVQPGMKLILNADDPLVSRLADKCSEVVRFGASPEAGITSPPAVYDDGAVCPVCGGKMEYSYRTMADFGGYRCTSCGYSRVLPEYALEGFDLSTGEMRVNGTELKTPLRTVYNAYNILAAYAIATELGVSATDISSAVGDYFLRNGRVRVWRQNGRRIVLLTSKHENSTSYDSSLDYAARAGGEVLVIVDAISRKYFTGETSWLWDVNFDLLAADSVRKVMLAGTYVWDLAERFSFTGVDAGKLEVLENLDDIRRVFASDSPLYVITCFSDRGKFLSRLPEDAVEGSELL